jgi:LuxR family maltose regulon positive regulatory protein
VDTPLLATKLFVPQPRPGLVARPRLMERLDGALGSGLVLVSAPAGSGKTTVVSQWVRQNSGRIPAVWVSLDDGDNDPVRFWDYFIAALKTFKPAAGDAASTVLHSAQSYSIDVVLVSLINDLADIHQNVAVVFDDYHLITSEAIHGGVAFLIDHLPPAIHLILASRADPPLPLPHFRGRGTLVELGADDLRFTDEEAAGLLQDILGARLPAEQIAALNAHTEGWVVGLKMAALSMRGQKDVQSFISGFTGSQRYVMDYLLEEVLKRQTEEVRDFLLKTSVLERMTAPLCDFLTGGRRGRDMLIELDRANLFLVPLDDTRQWYRYHHLFGELLRHQLAIAGKEEGVVRLHRRASTWYESAGLLDDSMRHSLKAHDFETSTRLIGSLADGMVGRGEWNTLFDWFQEIPEDVLRHHPAVYHEYANVLLTRGNLEAADPVLDYLDRATGAEQDLQGQLAFLQSIVAYRRGHVRRMTELAQRALQQLPPDSLAARARLHGILAIY